MDFEKLCMMFTMQEPYYGILLSSMERIPDDRIGTLAVARPKNSNVFKLFYSPKFVERFDVDTVLQLLKHETIHLALGHMTIFEDKQDRDALHDIENIAVDAEANCYIDRNKMQKEAGGIWVEDFGLPKNLGAREYYNLFLKKAQQQAQAQQPQQPCNGGQGGDDEQENDDSEGNQSQNQGQNSFTGQNRQQDNGELDMDSPSSGYQASLQQAVNQMKERCFDDHKEWPDMDSESDIQELQEAIDTLVDFAAQEVEKACGEIPGEIAGRIEKIRKKPKPVADWRRYFRRYLGNEFSELIKKSRKRESKRFPDAAGNRHQRKSHILVGIDTSGSVSMPEYMEFFGQIKTLQEKATFHVVECDARIQHEYDYRGKPNEVLHGGEGTNFSPVIDLFNKNRKKYDALVYFTDGKCWIPNDTPKETLWVISSRGDHNRNKYKVNGASVVFIQPKNS